MKLAFGTILTLIVIIFGLAVIVRAADEPVPESVTTAHIHLTVVTYNQALFNGEVSVTPCDSDGQGTILLTAYCALEQSSVPVSWSWWGSDAFLDSVGGVANDFVNNWYWGWFANLQFGQTAMNKYALQEGDSLLLTFNINPLRLTADTLYPDVGGQVTFKLEQFGYDEAWNPVWLPSVGGVVIGDESHVTDANGVYVYLITDAIPFGAEGHKEGFVTSPALTLAPAVVATPEPPAPVIESGSSSGGGQSSAPPAFSLSSAIAFLIAHQDENGSFGDPMYTDWATIALSAASGRSAPADQAAERVRRYLEGDSLSGHARLTDYERRAFALLAADINPYTGTETNYIAEILSSFDGKQFGDPDQDNDDIFALLVLAKSGYSSQDEVITKTITHLISRQGSSGAWFGVDMTAAAVQALQSFSGVSGVTQSLASAERYLESQQGDGGFGNIFSLAWAMQALTDTGALSRADEALGRAQQADGGFELVSASPESRLWASAYAIPAGLHRAWPRLLHSFKKYIVEEPEESVQSTVIEPAQEPEPVITLPTPAVLGETTSVSEPVIAMPPVQKLTPPVVVEVPTPAPLTASAIEVLPAPSPSLALIFGGVIAIGCGVAFLMRRRFKKP